ncbi:hypothetical protein JA1_002885 [Spathaspora sp. JA1]|nr:hypothetical protein JA1_002885 [Spathaspora sp. JA1]
MTIEKSNSKEEKLEEYIFTHPELESIRGKPHEVLRLIEEYAPKIKLSMLIGPQKGKVVIDEMKKCDPKLMIELGCYVGYSAILFASELPDDAKYYSFEINEKFAAIATKLIKLAGLQDKVTIFVGKACDKLPEFRDWLSGCDEKFKPVDFIFIDHWKDMYVPDLRVLETLGLIAPGTIVAADNILYPGVPDYAKYVKGSPRYRKEYNLAHTNKNGGKYLGRWNVLYESDTIEVESQELYIMLIQLNKFIKDVKSAYLAVSDEYSNPSTLSIDDKNEIDQDFNYKIQQMYKKLNYLETYESKRQEVSNVQDNPSRGWFTSVFADDEVLLYHETITIHRKQVLRFLMETLNYVNKTFDSIQQKRLTRERQLNLLNFQNIQEDEIDIDDIPPQDDLDIINNNGNYFDEEQVSPNQLQELEYENQEFLNLKINQVKQVEKVQQSILDIINIQNDLSFKLQDQGNQIGNLMDTHSEIEMEVSLGNKTLNKSKKSNKKAANMLITMAIVFGCFILFVDYISF